MKEKFTATMARTMKQNLTLVGHHQEPTPVESATAALAEDIPWPGERAKAVLSAIEARASRSHFNGLRCEALAKVPHEAIAPSLCNTLTDPARKDRETPFATDNETALLFSQGCKLALAEIAKASEQLSEEEPIRYRLVTEAMLEALEVIPAATARRGRRGYI